MTATDRPSPPACRACRPFAPGRSARGDPGRRRAAVRAAPPGSGRTSPRPPRCRGLACPRRSRRTPGSCGAGGRRSEGPRSFGSSPIETALRCRGLGGILTEAQSLADPLAVVIVWLGGGVGNQLFQYAAGRRLALARGVELAFDVAFLAPGAERSYQLGHFDIQGRPAREAELWRFVSRRLMARAWRACDRWGLFGRPAKIVERTHRFDGRVHGAAGSADLYGYWQCERYFEDAADVLQRELVFRSGPAGANAALLDRIAARPAVSVHARRSVYLSNPQARAVHPVCGVEYYRGAAEFVEARVTGAEFFVFSD